MSFCRSNDVTTVPGQLLDGFLFTGWRGLHAVEYVLCFNLTFKLNALAFKLCPPTNGGTRKEDNTPLVGNLLSFSGFAHNKSLAGFEIEKADGQ